MNQTVSVMAMILVSTVLAMIAGIKGFNAEWSWCWGLLCVDFFVLLFGILMPFRYHYTRSRRYRGGY